MNEPGARYDESRGLEVTLRETTAHDLEAFFEQQRDADAHRRAAFTAHAPDDRAAFDRHWQGVLGSPAIRKLTILADGTVAGHIAGFERDGVPEVGYWLGRAFWGKGIATAALRTFLAAWPRRPLYARVASDNAASIRVLEKCGFRIVDVDRGYALARGEDIDEVVLHLSAGVEGEYVGGS